MNSHYQTSSTLDLSTGAAKAPLVCVLVLNYKATELTINCVGSVLKITYPNFRLIVIDNGSRDDSAEKLSSAFSDPRVEILVNDENYGYAGGNNRGIERALSKGAEYIFVLNNDTIAEPGCLTPLVEAMERNPRLGIAGCPILDLRPGAPPIMRYGFSVNLFRGSARHLTNGANWTEPHEVDVVWGAAILLRSEIIRRVGMFDSKFFLTLEETDLCYRARAAGYQVAMVPGPSVLHLVSQTFNRVGPLALFYCIRNQAWFIRRHGKLKHRIAFNIFQFGYMYPRTILGRLVRRQFELLGPLLRGIWEGHCEVPVPPRAVEGNLLSRPSARHHFKAKRAPN